MSSLSSSLSFSCASSSSTISLSISYGDENRQMWFPTSMAWNDVRSSILSCYLLSGLASDYRFSYTDEEGDDIAIEHDSEFIEAKRSAVSKGSYLQLSLVRVAQNGAPLSSNGRSKDDFASLEDNSDLEESYVSVNDIAKTPSNQSIVVIEEKKADNTPVVADANNEKKDENIIDDALSALQEAEQQQIKTPINESDEKASPPSVSDPIIIPPAVVQESSVSSLANDSAPLESKKSQNIDAALGAISSLLATSDAQEGLAKAVSSSLINYSISIASPSDADLIRSQQSLLEERVNDGVNGRINTALLARLLIRRLFSPKKPKTPTKRKKSLKSQPATEEPKPVVAPSSSPSSSSSSSSSSSGSGRALHLGVSCDVCNVGPIVGARYHCITCDENDEIHKRGGWDCCEECETKANHCTAGPVRHVLIKMKTPAKIVVEKEQPSQQWIESGQPLIYDAFVHFGDESKAVPLGVVNDRFVNEPQKAEKKRGKKYAKRMLKMLVQQFSDESLSCSDSSSDDESAERKLTKKMEKQKKKAEKALRKAEKLKMKAEKKAGKAAEKAEAKMDEEKQENAVEKKDVIEKKEENKDEAKENDKEEPVNPSNAPENQSSIQVESAAAASSQNITNNPEPVIKTEPSSSSSSASSSFLSFFSCVDSSTSITEQKADIPLPVAPAVPLPVAQPVISVPPPPPASSLPSILPAPFFPPPPSSLPPFNPFTFPPVPVPGSSIPSSSVPPSPPSPPLFFAYPDQLAQLTAMGFPRERSMELLNYYSGDLRKALNRLL